MQHEHAPHNFVPRMPAREAPAPEHRLHVEFYLRPVFDKKLSAEKKREVYKDVEYCKIRFPGDKNRIIDQPAHGKIYLDRDSGQRYSYAERFYQHYEVFKHGGSEQVIGTPLKVTGFLTPAKIAEFEYLSIRTVEQLASIPDANLRKMGMGARDYRDKARDWLDQHEAPSGKVAELQAQNDALMERLAKMEAEMKAFQEGSIPAHTKPVPEPKAEPKEAAPEPDPEPEPETETPLAAENETQDDDSDPYEDVGQDLGAGADFENWKSSDLKMWLYDMGTEAKSTWMKPRLVAEARKIFLERKKEVEQGGV